MKKILTTLMVVLSFLTASASTKIGNLYYNLNTDTKTAEVTYLSFLSGNENYVTGSLTIPSTVKSGSVTYSVTSIGWDAFYGCTGLTRVTIPNSVTSIGSSAFYDCKGLTNVTIGNSVTSIGYQAFAACEGLTSVTIPNSVTSIGESAFENCTGLTSVTIPSSVSKIGPGIFASCDKLTSINVNASNSFFTSEEGILFSKDKKILYQYPAGKASTTYYIPNSVTKIESSAFEGCTGLTSVTIPNSVTSIGSSAFHDCKGMTNVTIGNSVKEIGNIAFLGCTGLTSVTIPKSVTKIGKSAFAVTYITTVIYNAEDCQISEFDYTGDPVFDSKVKSVTIGKDVKKIPDCMFYKCSGLESLTFEYPSSLESIGDWAFNGCTSLVNVEIPGSVTTLQYCAFYDCSGLENITFQTPSSLATIGEWVFNRCNSLTTVKLPESLKKLENCAFYNCEGLNYLIIPASVETIGDNAFGYCSDLKKIYNYSNIPQAINSTVFAGIDKSTCSLYVPKAEIETYKKATVWSEFKSILPLPIAAEKIKINSLSLEGLKSKEELKRTETIELSLDIESQDATFEKIEWCADIENAVEFELPEETDGTKIIAKIKDIAPIGSLKINAKLIQDAIGAEDISDTYVFNIKELIPGDANDNESVNVADVVTISDVIVNKEVLNFCFVNADINYDNRITTSDLTSAVNLILDEVPSIERMASKSQERVVTNDVLKLDDFSVSPSHFSKIEARLENTNTYSALHTTILIPDGMDITEVSKGTMATTHSLNYNIIDGKILEILLYSLSNEIIGNGEGSLFSIAFTAKEDTPDFQIQAVKASDAHSNEFELGAEGGRNITHTTAVGSFENSTVSVATYISGIEILNAEQSRYDVYSLAGETIVSDIAKSNLERIPLEKGIYLVVVNDKAFKALVK